MTSASPIAKPNYGLDAPGFQRGALYGGLAALLVGNLLVQLQEHGILPPVFRFAAPIASAGLGFFLTGCVMFWGSRVGKLQLRDKIIRSISWRGDERVLDVGCGHGLMLLAAARQLTTGHAIGIDVWSQVDQADNSAEATLENARLEGVLSRVEVLDADARKLPFPDASFDVVLSSFVIHNLSQASDRQQIVQEIARVLRPGGQLRIADIRHTRQYAAVLRELGWTDVQRWFPNFLFVTPTRVLKAGKP